jgi:ribosomal protein S18 acetylase RimI-like enzyme
LQRTLTCIIYSPARGRGHSGSFGTVSPASPVQAGHLQAAGLVIRPAGPADRDAIAGLESASFVTDRLTPRSLRALIAAPSARVVVAERDGAIAGYALVLLRGGSRIARLYSIAVAVGAAGRGTGHRLVEAAEKAALEAGRCALRLEVRADNARAIALYEDLGYRRLGERPHYYEDGMTALRYEKPLSSGGGLLGAATAANRPPVPVEPSA